MRKLVSKLGRAKRGAVMVEYAFLLAFVVVPASAALLKGGQDQYKWYLERRSAMLSPFP